MLAVDMVEKRYMKEICRFLSAKTVETLGCSDASAKKSATLAELKKMVDGADHDEPRLSRALDHMTHAGWLEKDGFRWVTTPDFSHWKQELQE